MKEVSVSLWEVSFDEVLRLPDSTRVLMYLPQQRKYEYVSAEAIRFAYTTFSIEYFLRYVYFTFEKPEIEMDGEAK